MHPIAFAPSMDPSAAHSATEETEIRGQHEELLEDVPESLFAFSSENTPVFLPSDAFSSVTSPHVEEGKQMNMIDWDTVATLKAGLASSSRLIGTFSLLKSSYLKLCEEFNSLLGKFNENERIKFELINENNELRKFLTEVIKERELDRRAYKELQQCARCNLHQK